MSHRATEQELAAAKEVARVVDARGGKFTVNVDELLATFGVTRFTVASRDRIGEALAAQRVTSVPSIHEVRRGESIALTTRAARPQFVKPTRSREPGQKPPWYRRPAGIAAIAVLLLFVIVGALGSGSEPQSESKKTAATSTPTATPTPTPEDPAAARTAALADADDALDDDNFPAVLAAVAVLDEPDVVDRYKRRIARRVLRRARRALRTGAYARALTEARRARSYQRTPAARGIMASARRGLAVQRARKRARERAARLARDQRTCSSSEKRTVRYGGGVPAGCTDYSVQLADRRAAREAARAAEEAESIPEVDAPSSDGGGESGNWCGATRDGDGDGIWCEGE